MIRILHTGDLHIGREYKKQEQENREIARRYKQARVEALKNIVRIAGEEECDYLIIAGDLYDKKDISLSLHKEVCAILGEYNGTVLILPGNHDYYEGEGDKLWSRFLEAAGENILLIRENREIEMDGISFFPCICHDRYSEENALSWIKLEKEKREKMKVGIAHGAIEGLSYDKERKYYYMTREELEKCQMDLWLIGHTHMPYPEIPYDSKISGEHIFNAGTSQQTDLADNARGSVFLIDIDKYQDCNLCNKRKPCNKENREKKDNPYHLYNSYNECDALDYQISVRKIPTNVIWFEKREVIIKHGEKLQEKIEESIVGMDKKNTTLRLILSGVALEDDYEQRTSIYQSYEEQFLKFEVIDFGLQPEITRERIERETLDGSIENRLLLKYLDNPELLNLAFELIKSCKN